VIGYKVIEVSWLLSGEDLVGYGSDFNKIYSCIYCEPVEIRKELRCGD